MEELVDFNEILDKYKFQKIFEFWNYFNKNWFLPWSGIN